MLRADETPGHARPDPARFAKDIAKFDDAEKETPPKRGGIVFTGSSSVRLWDVEKAFPDLPVLNRGFGGSVANDLIVYAEKVVLRYQPKVLVVYTGSNDLHGHPSRPCWPASRRRRRSADYTKFLTLVHDRLPQTRVIVSSVKVAPSRAAEMERVKQAQLAARSLVPGQALDSLGGGHELPRRPRRPAHRRACIAPTACI